MPDQRESRAVSPWSLMLGTGPRFARDAFGPVVVFYIGWKLVDLRTGILAATALAVIAYLWERRRDRSGVTAAIGLGIALVQAAAGLATGSTTGYFAPGLIVNGAYGLAFLGSVLIGPPRPSPRRRVRAGALSLFPRDSPLGHLPPRVLPHLAGVGGLSPASHRHSHDRPPADERGDVSRDQCPHGDPPHRRHHGVVHLVRPPAILDEPGVAPGRSGLRKRSSVAAGTGRRTAGGGDGQLAGSELGVVTRASRCPPP